MEVRQKFLRYSLKASSSMAYTDGIKRFFAYIRKTYKGQPEFVPTDFTKLGLKQIEDWMTDFIVDHRETLAPKYLNVIYSSVKRWCYILELVKTTKMFKEIKFDKSSRKTSGLMETMLSPSPSTNTSRRRERFKA